MRLHIGLAEPETEGTMLDKPCPLCGALVRPGHHRWCAGLASAPSLQHHKLRDDTAKWMAEAATLRVTPERPTRVDGGGGLTAGGEDVHRPPRARRTSSRRGRPS